MVKKINLILSAILLIISSFAYVGPTYASVHTWDFTNSSDYNFDISKLNVSAGEAKMKNISNPAWYNDSWAYRKKITIDKTKVLILGVFWSCGNQYLSVSKLVSVAFV